MTRRPAQELLTFVFVGGGYAGLEALAELQDFAAEAIETYPRASLQGMRWILVEAMDRVLPEIDPRLADYALRQLRGRGIDIRLGTTLEEVTATSARISTGETVGTRTVVWTAGVVPHPERPQPGAAGRRARSHRGRRPPARAAARTTSGRSATAAAVPDPAKPGRLCPPTSQHAIRQGRTAGRNVAASLGVGDPAPFSYKTLGAFVNLGRYKAVARVGPFTFRGFPAWWLARTYHVSQIPGTARKVRAVMDWTVGLPFKRDIAEVGSIGHPRPLRADAYERVGHAPQLARRELPAYFERRGARAGRLAGGGRRAVTGGDARARRGRAAGDRCAGRSGPRAPRRAPARCGPRR